MRKLRLRCEHGSAHYKAAATAITEIGVTKGFHKEASEVSGDLDDQERGIFGDGCFTAQMDESGFVLVSTWVETCKMMFLLSWPDLRMVSMQSSRCVCHALRNTSRKEG